MDFDFTQTYLYKMHRLTNSLDTTFDMNLRRYAGIGLSQFTLLLAVQQHQKATQSVVANFLGISPGAISRQVEIASAQGWITTTIDTSDRRKQYIQLTELGKSTIANGISQLETHVFSIFADDNRQTNLMNHIVQLQQNIDNLEQ